MAHNGGKVQTNLYFSQISGDYLHINHLKHAQLWSFVDNSGSPDPTTLDSNGYPTSISNGGVYTVFYIPAQSAKPGNYVVKWTGGGTIYTGFSHTLVSGSYSGTNGRFVFTPTGSVDATLGSLRIPLGISAITTGITDLVCLHESHEAAYDSGEIFNPDTISRLNEPPFGVLRFLDLLHTNSSSVSVWAHRKPTGYVFYDGHEMRGSLYKGSTTNSGDAYSLAGSGSLTDKLTLILRWNASATSTTVTLNYNGTGAKNVKAAHGSTMDTTEKPLANTLGVVVYDAALDCWLKFGGDGAIFNTCLNNGWPPEVLVALCNKIGAHPWFNIPYLALDPLTDYTSSLTSYCSSNLNSGLIPRIEPSNEVWNSIFNATVYGWNRELARGGGATDTHQWYGRALAKVGTAVLAAMPTAKVICGVQTVSTPSNSSERLLSTRYVSEGGVAAKTVTTHIAVAGYIGPSTQNTAQETTWADEYATASAERKLEILALYTDDARITTYYDSWRNFGNQYGISGYTQYEGGHSPDYSSGSANVVALRRASKGAAALGPITTQNLTDFCARGGEFPSQYVLSGVTAWGMLDPDIYAADTAAWRAMVAFKDVQVAQVSSMVVYEEWVKGGGVAGAGATLTWTGAKNGIVLSQGGAGNVAYSNGIWSFASNSYLKTASLSTISAPFLVVIRARVTSGAPTFHSFSGNIQATWHPTPTTVSFFQGATITGTLTGYVDGNWVTLICLSQGTTSAIYQNTTPIIIGGNTGDSASGIFRVGANQFASAPGGLEVERVKILLGSPTTADIAAAVAWSTGTGQTNLISYFSGVIDPDGGVSMKGAGGITENAGVSQESE